jgi:chaperonin GroES
VALEAKASDRVLFGKWSSTEVKPDGEDLLVLKEGDLLDMIEGTPALAKPVEAESAISVACSGNGRGR